MNWRGKSKARGLREVEDGHGMQVGSDSELDAMQLLDEDTGRVRTTGMMIDEEQMIPKK